MINSEGIIKNKGTYSNGTWSNVVIQPRYPNALPNGTQQNSSSNQLSVNDHIIDNNGFVWKVTSCSLSGTDYICSITQQGVTPSSSMEPNTALEKGIVVTANSKGLLAPYYHDSYVTTNAFRAAMAYNMKVYSTSGGDTGGGDASVNGFYTDGSEIGFLADNMNGSVVYQVSFWGSPFSIEAEFTPINDIHSSDVRGFIRFWHGGTGIVTNLIVTPTGKISWDNISAIPTTTSLVVGTKYIVKVELIDDAQHTGNVTVNIYINNIKETSFVRVLPSALAVVNTYLFCPKEYGEYGFNAKLNFIKAYSSSSLLHHYPLNNSLECILVPGPSTNLGKMRGYEPR